MTILSLILHVHVIVTDFQWIGIIHPKVDDMKIE